MVGSLNKIPLTIIGRVIFGSLMTTLGTLSTIIVLISGVWYTFAKLEQHNSRQESFASNSKSFTEVVVKVNKLEVIPT